MSRQGTRRRPAKENQRRWSTAARRQKITTLILPDANRGDYDELPEYLKSGLTVHFAKQYGDVYQVVFGNKPKKGASVH